MVHLPISLVIPTLDAETGIAPCIAAASGVAEVVVADGGSRDGTVQRARQAGARCIEAPAGRGPQLVAGAAAARSPWLLFLHADTLLATGWREEVGRFIAGPGSDTRAAVFTFALDHPSPAARRLEAAVRFRTRLLALPYGDQGLLISRRLYDELGGYEPISIMEDVDIVRRIGRRRLTVLETHALTSAARWDKDGFLLRSSRNLACLALYYAGLPPDRIRRLYG